MCHHLAALLLQLGGCIVRFILLLVTAHCMKPPDFQRAFAHFLSIPIFSQLHSPSSPMRLQYPLNSSFSHSVSRRPAFCLAPYGWLIRTIFEMLSSFLREGCLCCQNFFFHLRLRKWKRISPTLTRIYS